MKTAMSDDGGDSIEQQIQAHYEKFRQEPGDRTHALAIGALYEQRKEYANAIPWLENAFNLGGRVEYVLERRILDLRILGLKEELVYFQKRLDAEDDPQDQAEFKAKLDGLLEELSRLLALQKKREAEHRDSLCDWSPGPRLIEKKPKPER